MRTISPAPFLHLIYFDEVKHDDEKQADYWLGAVVIEESRVAAVEDAVSALAEEYLGSRLLSRETEFHAAELFHRKAHFKSWNDFGKRIGLMEKLIVVLAREDVSRIYVRIEVAKLKTIVAPDQLAFMFLCEKANALMAARKSLGMLIGDRDDDSVAERCASRLSNYRTNKTDYAPGFQLKHLIDTVHFTHSHLSRMLQLADVHIWCRQFRSANRDTDNARNQALLALMKKHEAAFHPNRYKEFPND